MNISFSFTGFGKEKKPVSGEDLREESEARIATFRFAGRSTRSAISQSFYTIQEQKASIPVHNPDISSNNTNELESEKLSIGTMSHAELEKTKHVVNGALQAATHEEQQVLANKIAHIAAAKQMVEDAHESQELTNAA